MNDRPPPRRITVQPLVLKLDLKHTRSDSTPQLGNESLPFHALEQTRGEHGCGTLEPTEMPVIGEIGTLNRDLTEVKKYWTITAECIPARRTADLQDKPTYVRFALDFNGPKLSDDLRKLAKEVSGKLQPGDHPAYVLFKALAQRERIFVELRFGSTSRVLAIEPSVLGCWQK